MQSSTTIEFTLSADYQYLEKISTVIDEFISRVTCRIVPEQTSYNIKLSVHEICNNIIEHAYHEQGGLIHVKLTIDETGSQFIADLDDTGDEFNPSTVTLPDFNNPQEEGYGLFLARQLMDEVRYTRQGAENHWRLTKTW